MNIFHDDLLKNKYFLGVVVFIGIIIAVIWFIDFNSIENKCQRYAQGLGSMLGAGDNRLQKLQLESASQPLVEDCIKRGGP